MQETYIHKPELDHLPRWVCVAFAARCARRTLPVLQHARPDGFNAVDKLLDSIDAATATAREFTDIDVFDLVDEVDDIERRYGCRSEDCYRVASRELAAAKFAAFGLIEYSSNVSKNAWDAYRNAASAACFSAKNDPDDAITNSELVYEEMRRDLEHIKQLSQTEPFSNQTPVPADAFGPMWPGPTPSWATGQSRWDAVS